MSSRELLDVELGDNDSGKQTLGGFLVGMINLDEKRPYGNSGWVWDLYGALIRAGKLKGSFNEWGEAEPENRSEAADLLFKAVDELKGMFR